MARAGFDPRASVELWSIMSEVEKEVEESGGAVNLIDNVGLLRTHPTGEARLVVSLKILLSLLEIRYYSFI